MQIKNYFNQIMEEISSEMSTIDIDGCDISSEESFNMVEFLQGRLKDLREKVLACAFVDTQEEIKFFKEMKPQILSLLLYFNKTYTVELKRPNGSNMMQKSYYENILDSLTYFFNRNLDFYQYYRSNSTHLDECYFVRGKPNIRLCVDSSQFISDPLFSTEYDYKVSKILSNEMLRIFLNKKLQNIDKQLSITSQSKHLLKHQIQWTASKSAAVELGYALYSTSVLNKGNLNIQEIMLFLQNIFNIDLGDYYRTYVAIKNRKKDRTAFLKQLIDNLEKRMDEELDI